MKKTLTLSAAIAALSLVALQAQAQDSGYYVQGSLGLNTLSDSSNSGTFTEDFTAGFNTAGVTTIPAGADVGWSTEFDDGLSLAGAVGFRRGPWRFEGELSYQENDVDTHRGVSAAGIDLTDVDAAILVSGTTAALGVTTGDLVAAGQGEVTTTALFANVYYDFETDSAFTPYVGAGFGFAALDVDYSPSDTAIISDDDSVYGFQLMAGASYALTEQLELVGDVRYRSLEDAEVDATLFPAEFDVENDSISLNAGLRFNF
jgi:opacity protein-like surface antigen